jgi:hypothetical protein
MEYGALPWEASRACLDLLGHLTRKDKPAPLNALAEKFWRVTQAAPDALIEVRLALAGRFLVFEELGRASDLRECERYLMLATWREEDPPGSLLPNIGLTWEELDMGGIFQAIESFMDFLDPQRWTQQIKQKKES